MTYEDVNLLLPLGGYSDWRLPNRNELQSIVAYNRSDPAIDTTFFPGTEPYGYWSSTTVANESSYAWDVSFGSGGCVGSYSKNYSRYYVHAVRGGQCTFLQKKDLAWTLVYEKTSKLSAIWGTSSSDVFVVGGNGIILHYDESSWCSMLTSSIVSLAAVWGNSGTDVFAVGDNVILHYNGNAWSKMALPNGLELKQASCVWGSSANDVFVGFQEGIIHFDGTSWSKKMCLPVADNTRAFKSIWGTSSTDVFAVGWYGLNSDAHSSFILHYDGKYWSEMSSMEGLLLSIWGFSNCNIYAVGRGGIIFHYDGTQWSKGIQQWSKKDFYGIWGVSPKDVFVVGEYDQTNILHYDGEEWLPIDTPFQGNLYGIWGSPISDPILVGPSGDPFAVGEGVILHYTNEDSSTTTSIPSGTTTTTTTAPDSQCVAEAIYGSDSEETELLRKYRDKVLSKSATGRQMIKTYYELSPAVAEVLQKNDTAKSNARRVLDSLMPAFRKKVKQ